MRNIMCAPLATIAFALALSAATAQTPAQPQILINIDHQARTPLVTRDLLTMTSSTVSWTHNNVQHSFTAVPLEAIAEKYGVNSGPKNNDVPKSEKR